MFIVSLLQRFDKYIKKTVNFISFEKKKIKNDYLCALISAFMCDYM